MSLEGVKVGDWLYYFGRRDEGLTKVESLTATQAVTGRGVRYRIKDGRRVGSQDAVYTSFARIASPEDVAKANEARRIRRAAEALGNLKVNSRNVGAIEAFLGALQEQS